MTDDLPPSGKIINAWLSLFVTPFLDVAKKNMDAASVARRRELTREYQEQQREQARSCTCHPDDNPPKPCAEKYALTECRAYQQEQEREKREGK